MSVATETPQLATVEEMEQAFQLLLDALVSTEAVAQTVYRVINVEDRQTVTYEQVGRLACWAADVQRYADILIEHAAKVQEAALDDLNGIARDGSHANEPTFNAHGERVV
jgi:hypothetical protein